MTGMSKHDEYLRFMTFKRSEYEKLKALSQADLTARLIECKSQRYDLRALVGKAHVVLRLVHQEIAAIEHLLSKAEK
jgi:ribosomal protein L29